MRLLGLVLAAAVGFSSAGCAEIESVSAEPYEPAALESTGPSQPAKITLTEEAARRVALQTTVVGGSRRRAHGPSRCACL